MNGEAYAYCENMRCRLHLQTQWLHPNVVEFVDGRLATECRCGMTLTLLTEDDLREFREARNRIKQGDGGET